MTDSVDNLPLEHLKGFRNEFHLETGNLKHRMSSLESAMIDLEREVTAGDETDVVENRAGVPRVR